jgi:hypothetical protein
MPHEVTLTTSTLLQMVAFGPPHIPKKPYRCSKFLRFRFANSRLPRFISFKSPQNKLRGSDFSESRE